MKIKIDYRELLLFFFYLDGPTLSTDIGKKAKSNIGKYLFNFLGDLGVNAVFYVILLVSAAAGFFGVLFFNNIGL